MPDLDSDLRTYFDALATRIERGGDLASPPPVIQRGRPSTGTRRERTGLLVALAAAVCLVVVGALLVAREEGQTGELTVGEEEALEVGLLRLEDVEVEEEAFLNSQIFPWEVYTPEQVAALQPGESPWFSMTLVACATTFDTGQSSMALGESDTYRSGTAAGNIVTVVEDEAAAERTVDTVEGGTEPFAQCLRDAISAAGPYLGPDADPPEPSLVEVTTGPAPGIGDEAVRVIGRFPAEALGGHDHSHQVDLVAVRVERTVLLFGFYHNSQGLDPAEIDPAELAAVERVVARVADVLGADGSAQGDATRFGPPREPDLPAAFASAIALELPGIDAPLSVYAPESYSPYLYAPECFYSSYIDEVGHEQLVDAGVTAATVRAGERDGVAVADIVKLDESSIDSLIDSLDTCFDLTHLLFLTYESEGIAPEVAGCAARAIVAIDWYRDALEQALRGEPSDISVEEQAAIDGCAANG